jgi:hypothetical protein
VAGANLRTLEWVCSTPFVILRACEFIVFRAFVPTGVDLGWL